MPESEIISEERTGSNQFIEEKTGSSSPREEKTGSNQLVLKEYRPLNALVEYFSTPVGAGSRIGRLLHGTERPTCIDACSEFIALGTLSCVLYIYDRLRDCMVHQLEPVSKSKTEQMTCVRLVQSFDDVIAAGMSTGRICIFPIKKPATDVHQKQVHTFIVKYCHRGSVTCLAWSPNASRLFSGDVTGTVVCTEFDYDKMTSQSRDMLVEDSSIVQLSYMYRVLVVSSHTRSIILSCTDWGTGNEVIKQVGQAARKKQMALGATLIPGSLHASDAVVYACRPGMRLWKADVNGTVTVTCVLKDEVSNISHNITTNDPIVLSSHIPDERQFGTVLPYIMDGQCFLVSYSGSSLYMIDPEIGKVVAYHHLLGQILDVSVCGEDILILRSSVGSATSGSWSAGERLIIQLSVKPPPNKEHTEIRRTDPGISPSPVSPLTETLGSGVRLGVTGVKIGLVGVKSGLQGVKQTIEEGMKDSVLGGVKVSLVGIIKDVGGRLQGGREQPKGGSPPWGSQNSPAISSKDDLDSSKEISDSSPIAPVSNHNVTSCGESLGNYSLSRRRASLPASPISESKSSRFQYGNNYHKIGRVDDDATMMNNQSGRFGFINSQPDGSNQTTRLGFINQPQSGSSLSGEPLLAEFVSFAARLASGKSSHGSGPGSSNEWQKSTVEVGPQRTFENIELGDGGEGVLYSTTVKTKRRTKRSGSAKAPDTLSLRSVDSYEGTVVSSSGDSQSNVDLQSSSDVQTGLNQSDSFNKNQTGHSVHTGGAGDTMGNGLRTKHSASCVEFSRMANTFTPTVTMEEIVPETLIRDGGDVSDKINTSTGDDEKSDYKDPVEDNKDDILTGRIYMKTPVKSVSDDNGGDNLMSRINVRKAVADDSMECNLTASTDIRTDNNNLNENNEGQIRASSTPVTGFTVLMDSSENPDLHGVGTGFAICNSVVKSNISLGLSESESTLSAGSYEIKSNISAGSVLNCDNNVALNCESIDVSSHSEISSHAGEYGSDVAVCADKNLYAKALYAESKADYNENELDKIDAETNKTAGHHADFSVPVLDEIVGESIKIGAFSESHIPTISQKHSDDNICENGDESIGASSKTLPSTRKIIVNSENINTVLGEDVIPGLLYQANSELNVVNTSSEMVLNVLSNDSEIYDLSKDNSCSSCEIIRGTTPEGDRANSSTSSPRTIDSNNSGAEMSEINSKLNSITLSSGTDVPSDSINSNIETVRHIVFSKDFVDNTVVNVGDNSLPNDSVLERSNSSSNFDLFTSNLNFNADVYIAGTKQREVESDFSSSTSGESIVMRIGRSSTSDLEIVEENNPVHEEKRRSDFNIISKYSNNSDSEVLLEDNSDSEVLLKDNSDSDIMTKDSNNSIAKAVTDPATEATINLDREIESLNLNLLKRQLKATNMNELNSTIESKNKNESVFDIDLNLLRSDSPLLLQHITLPGDRRQSRDSLNDTMATLSRSTSTSSSATTTESENPTFGTAVKLDPSRRRNSTTPNLENPERIWNSDNSGVKKSATMTTLAQHCTSDAENTAGSNGGNRALSENDEVFRDTELDQTIEDIYSRYRSRVSESELDSSLGPSELYDSMDLHLGNETGDDLAEMEYRYNSMADPDCVSCDWLELTARNEVKSLSVSRSRAWLIDVNDRLCSTTLAGPVPIWSFVKDPRYNRGQQVAVSPSGNVVCKVEGCIALIALDPFSRKAGGDPEWREIQPDVMHLSVEQSSAWCVSVHGKVTFHKFIRHSSRSSSTNSISNSTSATSRTTNKTRTSSTGRSVELIRPVVFVKSEEKVLEVKVHDGVVWMMDVRRTLNARVGITKDCPSGTDWIPVSLSGLGRAKVCSFEVGERSMVWLLDTYGRLWYMSEVTREQPLGSGFWWQVSLPESLMHEAEIWEVLKSPSVKDSQRPHSILPANRSGVLSARINGVWLAMQNDPILHVNPLAETIYGYRWQQTQQSNKLTPTKWSTLSVLRDPRLARGGVWLAQPFGRLQCFVAPPRCRTWSHNHSARRDGGRGQVNRYSERVEQYMREVEPPEEGATVRSLSAGLADVLWCILGNGNAYIRTDVSEVNLAGNRWEPVDLTQLGHGTLVDVSIGAMCVWVVHDSGQVYMRRGVYPTPSDSLSPAWIPVDSPVKISAAGPRAGGRRGSLIPSRGELQMFTQQLTASFSGKSVKKEEKVHLRRVAVSSDDNRVWAIDNEGLIYTRAGISNPELLIGTHWILVEGYRAKSLSVGSRVVHVATLEGEVVCRVGVTLDTPTGKRWVKLPGSMHTLAGEGGDLWGLDADGLLYRRLIDSLTPPACTDKSTPPGGSGGLVGVLAAAHLNDMINASNGDEWFLM